MKGDTLPTGIEVGPEIERIAAAMRGFLVELGRRGYVVAMSGGIDSSVCAALAVRAVGAERVLGLFLPERDSDPISLTLATQLAEQLDIEHHTYDIGPALEAVGCYRQRDEAVRRAVPEYGPDWRCKLVIGIGEANLGGLNVSQLVVQPPEGQPRRVRLAAPDYRQIVAATNFKQRTRAMMTYFHADCRHFAVVGTPNRLEYDQGFFVKGGDGQADVKPIAHLYKQHVRQLASWLGVPSEIIDRTPTTDTFSLPQSQEEFYFSHPVGLVDRIIEARDRDEPLEAVARELELSSADVESIHRDMDRKRAATRYLHLPALLVDPIQPAPGST